MIYFDLCTARAIFSLKNKTTLHIISIKCAHKFNFTCISCSVWILCAYAHSNRVILFAMCNPNG